MFKEPFPDGPWVWMRSIPGHLTLSAPLTLFLFPRLTAVTSQEQWLFCGPKGARTGQSSVTYCTSAKEMFGFPSASLNVVE